MKFRARIFLQDKKGRLLGGEGMISLLEEIESSGSLNKAAKRFGMSFRHAWKKMKKFERHAGLKLVETKSRPSKLTPAGKLLVRRFKLVKHAVESFLRDASPTSPPIYAQGKLEGKVDQLIFGKAEVSVRVKTPAGNLSFILPRESVEQEDLKKGDRVRLSLGISRIQLQKV